MVSCAPLKKSCMAFSIPRPVREREVEGRARPQRESSIRKFNVVRTPRPSPNPSLRGLVITHIFWRPGVGLADITGRGGATDGFA